MVFNHYTILPASIIIGKNLVLRNATPADARFIYGIRTNSAKSRFLNAIGLDVNDQINWLEGYKRLTDQAYFIIQHQDSPIGTVRLFNSQGDSFGCGSWILADGSPYYAAIESALIMYSYAIDYLGFNFAHFDVRKENRSVWRFHEQFGAYRVFESDKDYFYKIDRAAVRKAISRYHRYLPFGIQVKF